MLRLSKDRERSARWQRAAQLLLAKADVGAVSRQLELALLYDGKLDVRAMAWRPVNRPQLSVPLMPRAWALHRAEDISSALKWGVNVCQRQLVNEVFGPLVTEFVRNFGREDATPIQLGSNASLLGRVQAVKHIRHNALGHFMTN
jgi:hypothetical protein